MPQTPPILPRHTKPARTVDEALRRAFAPILAEMLPHRLSAALNGQRHIGPDNDIDFDSDGHSPK